MDSLFVLVKQHYTCHEELQPICGCINTQDINTVLKAFKILIFNRKQILP